MSRRSSGRGAGGETPTNPGRRFGSALGGAIALLLASAAVVAVPAPASAAPGDPFPVGEGIVFVSQGDPTGLFTAVQDPDGNIEFTSEGAVSSGRYNALAFRTSDMYLYAMRQIPGSGSRNLLRIGQDGQITGLGPVTGMPVGDYNQGTFGDGAFADTMFVRPSTAAGTTTMYAINVDAVTATTLTLSRNVPNVSDLVFKDGFVWAVHGEGQQIFRINPTNGAVSVYPLAGLGIPTNAYGAQWVYGNGNIGVSNNVTGRVFQIAITDPAAATPVFTVVSSVAGPPSGNNDGTAYPGVPADLSVEKVTPPTFVPGGSITYSLTVTNNGPGTSSGWFLNDPLPAGVTDVSTSSPECEVAPGVLTCAGGTLASGESTTLTFSGTTSDTQAECIANTVSVLGNEADPDPEDNQSTVTTCPGDAVKSFAVEKSVSPKSVARPGDTVTYTVTVSNTGSTAFTGDGDDVASFTDDLSNVLDDASFGEVVSGGGTFDATRLSWSGALDVGERHEVVYTVVVADEPGDHLLLNGVTPGPDGECIVDTQCSTTVPVAQFQVVKTMTSAAPVQSGQTIQYSVTVTNVGAYAYTESDPATLTDDLTDVIDDGTASQFVASSGDVSYSAPELRWAGALGVSETVTITYAVDLFEPIAGDGTLINSVLTPGDANCFDGSADADCTTNNVIEEAPFNLVVDKSGPPTFEAGGSIVFTITVTNDGPGIATPWTLTDPLDAAISSPSTTTSGCTVTDSTLECEQETPMAAGESVVITVIGTASPSQTECIENAVILTPGAGESDPSDNFDTAQTCPGAAVGGFEVQKSVASSVARAGETLTYTVTVTNTGAVEYTDEAPAGFTDDLSGVLDDATLDESTLPEGVTFTAPTLSWSGPLPVGGFTAISYAVTLPDPLNPGDNLLRNIVAATGDGSCVEAEACVTETPVASYVVQKTASPTQAYPGATVDYAITVTNTGQVDLTGENQASFTDDLSDVLEDATLDETSITGGATYDGPTLSWAGDLLLDTPVTVTYSVTVNAPTTGDMAMVNTVVTPPGSGGNCPAGSTDPGCTARVPILSFTVAKEAAVSQSDPSRVVVYTVTVTNTGAADYTADAPASFTDDMSGVLDDATYNDDATEGTMFVSPLLSWSGPLAVGDSAEVTYSVTVNEPVTGDSRLQNVVVPDGGAGGTCASNNSCATDTPVPMRSYDAVKTVSHTTAGSGDVVTFTIEVTNTGATAYTAERPAIIDDDLSEVLPFATYEGDATLGGEYTEPVLHWELPLAVGETVSLTYSVTISAVTAPETIRNLIVTGADGNCASSEDPGYAAQGCVTVTELTPVPLQPTPPTGEGEWLAQTGVTIGGGVLLGALGLIALGVLMAARRRKQPQE